MQGHIYGHIQIMKGHLADLWKMLCFVSHRFDIIRNKNDLFEQRHLRLTGCMPGDRRQNFRILNVILCFCNIGAQRCMQKIRRCSLRFRDLDIVLLAEL